MWSQEVSQNRYCWLCHPEHLHPTLVVILFKEKVGKPSG
jgi:hypothetical protein